jgi:hypothetical protein
MHMLIDIIVMSHCPSVTLCLTSHSHASLFFFLPQRRGFKLSPITALYYIAPAVVPLLLTIAVAKGEVNA